MTPGILGISIFFMLIGLLVQFRLRRKFKEYGAITTSSGLSGGEIAEKMLRDHSIYDVSVVSVAGFLTDYYDPSKKTINLSPDVYRGCTISSAAVAAHECGHAVQHATAYSMLQLRSRLVPITQISTSLSQWVILAGMGVMGFGGGSQLILLMGILLFAVSTLFSIITLPVEMDASSRALKWLAKANITGEKEFEKAKDALQWAALTYLVAALASVAMLGYYVMIYTGRSRA